MKLLVSDALRMVDANGSVAHPVYCYSRGRFYLVISMFGPNVGDKHPFCNDDSLGQVGTSDTPADDVFDGVAPATTICEYFFSAPLRKWIFVRHCPHETKPSDCATVMRAHYLAVRPLRLDTLLADVTTGAETTHAKKFSTCVASMRRCQRLIKRWLYSVHGSKACVVLDVAGNAQTLTH